MEDFDLKNLILKVFNDYPFYNKSLSIKNSKIAKEIRNGLNNIHNSNNILKNNLISKGFPGIGKWSTVPGIAILNKNISKSTRRGIYIVYLFSADGEKVYLSLNQGWGMFKDKYVTSKAARSKIKFSASNLRMLLKYNNNNINDIPINLNSKMQLPMGYEQGNILSIKYGKSNLPNNNILMKHLIDMIQIFNTLISKLDFNKNGEYNLNDYHKKIIEINNKISYKSLKIQNISCKETKGPTNFNNKPTNKRKAIKRDYEKSNKIKNMIGEYGENVVMQIEKDKLLQLNRKDLADEIEHVSKTRGDGLGYDIKSFDKYGYPIYIEVKSTTKGHNSAFDISSNELNIANKKYNKKELYKIYRLYDIKFDSSRNDYDFKYYIINGNLNTKLKLNATSYAAIPKE